MPAGLPDSLECGRFLGGLGRKVVELLQQRDRDGQQAPALLFGMGEPAVELLSPVDDHLTKYEF